MESTSHVSALAGKDLNLLVVFRAVAETGSVTRAAAELALSQPAVSHALRRLREAVGDPLFVRGKNGLVPTPHASSLMVPVRELLAVAETAFTRAGFEPGSEKRTFRVAASDFTASALFPSLFQKLGGAAPGICLDVRNVHRGVFEEMEDGVLDVCFIINTATPPQFHSVDLLEDRFVGVMHRGHPLERKALAGGVSLEDYLAFPHVEVSFSEGRDNPLRKRAHELGFERDIRAYLPNFASGLATLTGTEFLMAIPERLGASFIRLFDLVPFVLPFVMEGHIHTLVWHERTEKDPACAWLRQLVVINSQFID